jgi:integrase
MRGVYEKVKGSKDFYIRYTDVDGRRHREHVGSLRIAEEALINRRREIREGKFVAKEKKARLTFQELFDGRMADLKRTLSPNTFRHREREFNHARLDSLRNMLADRIRPQDIEAVLTGLHKEGRSDGTIRNCRAMISAVFAYGIKRECIVSNPALKTHQPPQEKERVRFLTKEEERAIREKIREHWPGREGEFDLLLHTGMRSGEAYKLTWDRVDLDRGMIDVPTAGKTGWRPIPVNSVCKRALETLHRQSRGSEFVIPRCGRWIDGRRAAMGENWKLGQWFRDALEKSGVLHATPHTLRHTFASRLVMAGVDLRTLQKFLGHSSIVMTMRYAHLSPEHGQAAIERLVTAIPPAPAKQPVRIRTARAEKVAKIA